jgi:probable F420-dependent oxidoreductase
LPTSTVTPGLSLQLPSFLATAPESWQPLFDRARAADTAGIHRIVVSDHVVFGENLEAYADPSVGGIEGGKQPTGPDGLWLEPMTVLSMVAAVTTKVRLSTGILIAALRRPVVLAKTAATLDVLSGGRLDLGVGVGWQREEYEAAGLPFEHRGQLLDESLAVLQTLWRDHPASFKGEHLAFDRIYCSPRPVHPDGIPILVSGTLNRRVLERIVRFGSGWIPWGPDIASVTTGVNRVRQALDEAGRDATGFEVVGQLRVRKSNQGGVDLAATMEPVEASLAAGITDFRLGAAVPDGFNAAVDYLGELVRAFDAVVAPTR